MRQQEPPRALVAHSFWGRGGAELAAFWMLEGMRRAGCAVTVLTRGGFDLDALGGISGLTLMPEDVEVIRTINPQLPGVGAIAHGAFIRKARQLAQSYDLRVTASGVLNWGAPAMHFISSVTWNDALAERFGAENAPGARSPIRRALWGVGGQVAGCPPAQGGAKDLFVANSAWTRDVSRSFTPGECTVLAPPMPVTTSAKVAPKREDAVLVLGRVSPEKDVPAAIRIVEAARAAGRFLTLHVVGDIGQDGCGQTVQALARERSEWVTLHGALYGERKFELLARCRYGLSACRVEAFGIATIEMMAAGLVVIAPRSGAQGESIGEPALLWSDESEAVQILTALDSDPAYRAALSETLRARAHRFGPETFADSVALLARGFLESGATGAKTALESS